MDEWKTGTDFVSLLAEKSVRAQQNVSLAPGQVHVVTTLTAPVQEVPSGSDTL